MLRRVMIGVSGQANDRPVADLEARFDYIAAMNGPGGGDRPSSEKGGELQALTSRYVNAGITRDATLHRMASVKWQDVLETNLGSCFNICRSVIKFMRASKFGRIVNIGSINSQAGQYGQGDYTAAKSGIHRYNKVLAQKDAKGVLP